MAGWSHRDLHSFVDLLHNWYSQKSLSLQTSALHARWSKEPLTCLWNTPLCFIPHKSDDSVPSLFPGVLSPSQVTQISHLGHVTASKKTILLRADPSRADDKSLKFLSRPEWAEHEREPDVTLSSVGDVKRTIHVQNLHHSSKSAGSMSPTGFSHRKNDYKKIKCMMYSRVEGLYD